MNYLHPIYIFINCIECFSPKELFENIIYQFIQKKIITNNYKLKCDNIFYFINLLKSDKIKQTEETIYFVSYNFLINYFLRYLIMRKD